MPARRIAVLAFPKVQAIDVFGPAEVFSAADRLAGGGEYAVELLATGAEPIETSSGIGIVPTRSISATRGLLDTLIVAGGDGVNAALKDDRLVRWVARVAPRTRRVCSVCTGAFLLAEAGLLDGRRATTHWAACEELARRYPQVRVEPDPIFVRDGAIATSAGVTAGIDLALALVEEDLGSEIAREAARWLVLFLKRPGGQSQFSAPLDRPVPERRELRELQEWMHGHLDEDLSVPVLAERALMSPRNFARVFRAEVGMTPAAYVERLRVERARSLLEAGEEPVESVAEVCGFGTVETLRRAFQRAMGVSPSQYRERFADRLSLA
jgi:transcriptional regulator GlxA family with amidase domain